MFLLVYVVCLIHCHTPLEVHTKSNASFLYVKCFLSLVFRYIKYSVLLVSDLFRLWLCPQILWSPTLTEWEYDPSSEFNLITAWYMHLQSSPESDKSCLFGTGWVCVISLLCSNPSVVFSSCCDKNSQVSTPAKGILYHCNQDFVIYVPLHFPSWMLSLTYLSN